MNQQQITICGCGWLGLPLADTLAKQGYRVFGTKQTIEDAAKLSQLGIQGLALTLPVHITEESELLVSAFSSECLIINVPPGCRGKDAKERAEAFKHNIQSLSNFAKQAGCKKLLFISTTSVYANCEGEVKEETPAAPNTASGHAHVWLENWLQTEWQDKVVILRLSGLLGLDRHPIEHIMRRFETAQKPIENGLAPVNFIHQQDVIQAISNIIAYWPERKVLHLAASTHPSRADYYQTMAKMQGLTPPQFVMSGSEGKWINATASLQALGLSLKYDDLIALPPYQ